MRPIAAYTDPKSYTAHMLGTLLDSTADASSIGNTIAAGFGLNDRNEDEVWSLTAA